MKLFKQYLKESLIVENTELADLKKHLHDQQMKYAAAQKRKDKRAMDFWNNAIKNTEEEIKYYENENFSSNSEILTKEKHRAEADLQKSKTDNDSKIKEYERNIDKYETKLGQLINSGGKPSEIAKIRRVINNYEDLLNKLIQ